MSEIHSVPCLHCQPSTYIQMVQKLIEKCLLFHMDQEQCVKALEEHAQIQPLVTLTVWNELLKENKDFFRSYFQSRHTCMKRSHDETGHKLGIDVLTL